jgi:hypothetical protein
LEKSISEVIKQVFMLEAFRGAILLGIGGTILFSLYYFITVAANLNNGNATSAFPMVLIKFYRICNFGVRVSTNTSSWKNR